MATIVRELVASLGLDIDRSSFSQGDRLIAGLKTAAAGIGLSLGVGTAIAAIRNVVTAASDVAETMNVVEAAFGENTGAVVEWARTSAKEVGRSEFMMREMAASLGALLTPMIKNEQASANMSTQLAQLAVDLSSFFNATENDALVALRAGLIGESEPLRRFGVQLSEARVQEKALSMGLAKGKKNIDNAAKAQARFAIILEDTIKAQGDAARTGDGYANLVRNLEGGVRDLRVELGKALLGPAQGLLQWLADTTRAFGRFISGTRLVQTALGVLGAALIPFALRAAIAAAPLLLLGAGLTAIILLVEDFVGMLNGKKSVIDEFFKELLGKKRWEEIKATWGENIGELKRLMQSFFQWMAGASPKEALTTLVGADRADRIIKGEQATLSKGRPRAPGSTVGDQEAEFVRANGFWGSLFPFWFGKEPQPSMSPNRGGGSVNIRGGDVSVSVQGNADRKTVNDIGREVQGAMDRSNRNLVNSAAALPSGG